MEPGSGIPLSRCSPCIRNQARSAPDFFSSPAPRISPRAISDSANKWTLFPKRQIPFHCLLHNRRQSKNSKINGKRLEFLHLLGLLQQNCWLAMPDPRRKQTNRIVPIITALSHPPSWEALLLYTNWSNMLDFEHIPWDRIETALRQGFLVAPCGPFSAVKENGAQLVFINTVPCVPSLFYSVSHITKLQASEARCKNTYCYHLDGFALLPLLWT